MSESGFWSMWTTAWRRVNRAIPRLLLLLIGFAGVLTLAAIGFSEYHYSSTLSGVDRLSTDRERIDQVESMYTLLVNAENGQRGYLLTGKPEFLLPLEQANEELSRMQNRLAVGFADRPAEMASADALRQLATRKLVELQTSVRLFQLGESQKALELFNSGQGSQVMDELRGKVGEFSRQLQSEFSLNRQLWAQRMFTARIGMIVLTLLSLLLLAYVVALLTRESEQREHITRLVDGENVRLVREVEARTAELNDLTNHLQYATEKDKAALARDLHDELGGILTSAKMDLDWLTRHSLDDAGAKQRMVQLSLLLDDAVQLKRRVIEDLRPSLLDNLGLVPALESYMSEHCGKAGIDYTLHVADDFGELDADVAITLYRIVQEALTNVIRHAGAAHFHVHLAHEGGDLVLEMEDDGKGFPKAFNPNRFSHGVSGMRQRARALGGEIIWTSAPGKGTTIHATIPRQTPAAA